MNFIRIWAISKHVFLELLRERLLYLAGLYAIGLVAGGALITEVAAATENKIITDFGLAMMLIFGLVIVIFTTPNLLAREVEKRTIFIVIAKPISRLELVVGKHLGLLGALTLLLVVMAGLYLGYLSILKITYPLVPVLTAIGFMLIEFALLTAAALLFSIFTSPLIAIFLTLATFFIGHLSSDVITLGRVIRNPQLLAILKGFFLVVPDLSRLDLKNTAVYGLLPDVGVLVASVVYGILYTVFLLALTVFIFARREF
ncbi:ABC transporter permease subunit [Gloeomargaritales cyanobacterium VI4D9]|nr:ABC transporter permease subunit [Gloeomargaritales cyanobacterium VI4D9]